MKLLPRSSAALPTVLIAAVIVFVVAASDAMLGAAQAPAAKQRTVWDGVFTADQAERGRVAFAQNCAECHNTDLTGGEGKPLTGDRFWNDWRESTVDELLDRISKNMPFSEDGSLAGTLSMSMYVDLVTHILNFNGFPAGSSELTPQSAVGVVIQAKEGPGDLPDTTLARVVGCLERGSAPRTWRLVKATRPERIRPGSNGNPSAPLGDRQYALNFVLTSLDKFIGYRMVATGALMGDGGKNGINVTTVNPVTEKCE